jgi:hypothetical protein
MAFTAQPYCTLADVKVALDPALTAVDDSFIETLIYEAQADLDREIGYSFQQDGTSGTPAIRLYDGLGAVDLWIDDLISPFSATVGAVFETSFTTFLSSQGVWITGSPIVTDITADIIYKPNNYAAYGLPARRMVRNSKLPFQEGYTNYKVLGIFGEPILAGQVYPGIPNDLMRACIRLCTHYYKMRDTNYADEMQERGGIREKYNKDWPKDVLRVVANYQHTRFVTRSS